MRARAIRNLVLSLCSEICYNRTMFADIVTRFFTETQRRLVFPSEVAADFWRRWLAEHGPCRAIDPRRIISWDMLKLELVPVHRNERPVSNAVRALFARTLLRANAEQPYLRVLVAPPHAETAAASAGALSALFPRLESLCADTSFARLPEAVQSDLKTLRVRYAALLRAYGLYEPNWELRLRPRARRAEAERAVLFFPETIEDYPTLAPYVEDAVVPVSIEDVPRSEVEARFFPSTRVELEAVAARIDAELSTGIAARDVVVSVADLDAVRGLLEEVFARYQVPYRIGAGEPLIRRPGGALFARLDTVLREGVGVQHLRELLMDRGVPWRNAAELRALIRFGYQSHAYNRREWFVALRAGEGEQLREVGGVPFAALRERFDAILRGVDRIRRARSLPDLRVALRRFMDVQLDHAAWHPDAERVYETALTALNETLVLEEVLRAPVETPELDVLSAFDPWSFYFEVLRMRTYVPVQSRGAVAVYDYRVAAGAPIALHFVVNASHANTRVRDAAPYGLRASDLEVLKWYARERSAPFLSAYARSGSRVVFSAAGVVRGGAHIAALEVERMAAHATGGAERAADKPPVDPYRAEARYWYAAERPPRRLFAWQAAGARAFAALHRTPPADNYQAARVPPELVTGRLPEYLSATSFQLFRTCPYAYFLRYRLKLETQRFDEYADYAATLGSLYHAVLSELDTAPGVAGESFAEAEAEAEAVVDRFLRRPEYRRLLPRVATPALRPVVAERCCGVLEKLREFEVGATIETEIDLDGTVELTGSSEDGADTDRKVEVRLRARVDRLAVGADALATVVDFKSGVPPGPGAVWGSSDRGPESASSLQLPFYAVTLHRVRGLEVDTLLYAALKTVEIKKLALAGTPSAKQYPWDLPGALAIVERLIADAELARQAGTFTCPEDTDCERCELRAVCRSAYVVRRFHE